MTRLVIFGSGDLTRRYLIPAIAELQTAAALPGDLSVVVAGRRDMSTAEFRNEIRDHLDGPTGESVSELLEYCVADVSDVSDVDHVRRAIDVGADTLVVYLALPPSVVSDAITTLSAAGLPAHTRIVVEKPFGADAASAAALNEVLRSTVPEEQVFRVDHFLGTQTAHDILTLRFGNRIFEQLWTNRDVASVEIVWDEALALEGRASYYDGTGAARDMIQSHLLQLLCLVAMEPPARLAGDVLAQRRSEVLRATRPWDPTGAGCSVRARYTAGTIDGHHVPAYQDEEGIDAATDTETYAQITFAVDTPRWSGVPFVLRSGKALRRDRHEVAIHFVPAPPVEFCADAPPPNVLRFQVAPHRVSLDAVLTSGEGIFALAPVELASPPSEPAMSAYASVLAGILRGDDVLAVRGEEAVEAWRVIEPVLDAWQRGEVPLLDYAAGSDGPSTH